MHMITQIDYSNSNEGKKKRKKYCNISWTTFYYRYIIIYIYIYIYYIYVILPDSLMRTVRNLFKRVRMVNTLHTDKLSVLSADG